MVTEAGPTYNSARELVLELAKDAVLRQRNNTYGPPTQDFDRAARMLNALGFAVLKPIDFETDEVLDIEAHHVAMIQMVVKLSRLTWSPLHMDSWVDLAGYAACGYECSERI